MKIVGVGLNKTGTSTLGVCLRHWGFWHISYNQPAFEQWRSGDLAALMQTVAAYDSFEDWPWPLLYRDIDAAFPGSKFILTRRKSPEVWYESLCRHAERTGPSAYRAAIYGYDMPHDHRAEHIAFYEDHLRTVRAYFHDRPDALLEVCWEEGDGWAELAAFLGQPQPDIPFPHANKKPSALQLAFKRAKRRVRGER